MAAINSNMIRLLQILLLLVLFSCNQTEKKQKPSQDHTPTTKSKFIDILEPDHDTLPNGKRLLENMDSGMVLYYKEVVGSDTLNGGTVTCYGIDDSTKYFYLRHGDTLHLLNKGSIFTSTWGLGTLAKDFPTFFMIQIDNGNGSPSSYQIFDKQTGKNILGDKAEAISYANWQNTLCMLYDNGNELKRSDSIILFNVRTKTKEYYKLPADLPEFCDIQIEKLSGKRLTLSFATYVGDTFERTKTYNR